MDREKIAKWVNQIGRVEKALADFDKLPDKAGAISEMRAILNQVIGNMIAAEDEK